MQYTLLKLTYLLSLCFFLLTSCVQQEIKKAFDRVNEGLVISNLTIEKRNDSLYNEIQKQTSEIKEQGQSARYSFNQYNMFITDLKDTMIARAGGRDESGGIKRPGDLNIPSSLMQNQRMGDTLFIRMEKLKLGLLSNLSDSTARCNIYNLLTPQTHKSEPVNSYYFHHVPVEAAITILTKLQNDGKQAENEFYTGLLRHQN